MNQQETPDPQNTSGPDNDQRRLPSALSTPEPESFVSPVRGRHAPLAGRPAARLLLISAAVSAALLAASAGVSALVASDGGSPAAAVGQPAAVEQPALATSSAAAAAPAASVPAASVPARAVAAAPATTAQAKAPSKPAAKPPTKATVKAPLKTATVRKVAPAPAPKPTTYRVVAGDTVSSIAARFSVSTGGVLAANGLGPSSVIVPGQVLKLSGPAVSAPAPAPALAPAPAPVPAPAPAPAVRTIYVAGAGGQAMVDSCIGPIHFTPTDGYSLFITEHDFCGGWARFSGIGVGERVDLPGYGSYRVSARGQVPNPGTTNDVAAVFGGFPRAVLQTCIPGTTQMLVIALN
ncbi:LysM peptidoglycan-binding domain-containing protein [Arthrobacter globiformis]|uniref:LysM peptidoglycan-binding domain-containing protein n=1 Tax=Arthrobacter globiformis TaxID=1665 RepID=UPI00277E6FA8|nr:LysM domain-containing protein [Arthrobacter globiformis]MDQ0866359.1 LysM repeat protein [Arthrobacter globiformis]